MLKPAEVPAPVNWRRNLSALWISQFAAIFGFSFVFPFLPLFLHQDLGVTDPRQLAVWSGLVVGATGLTQAIASPLWGGLGDRFGRKQMVARAMLGGGVTVVLMGLVRSPAELLAARLLLGVMSGTMPASTALVAAETPPALVGWALGILSSAVALGRSVGPLTGGVVAALFSYRASFIASGAILTLATVVVVVMVRESPLPDRRFGLRSFRTTLNDAAPGTVRVIGVLVACQFLMQFAYASTQQLVVLRLLSLRPADASFITGVAFAAVGLATIASATNYSRLIGLAGYRRLAMGAGTLMALAICGVAAAPNVPLVMVALAACGLVFGALNPALSAMIGLEAPAAIRATIFGFSASCISLGFAFGPLVAGGAAGSFNLSVGLYIAAAALVLTVVLLASWGREPVAHLAVAGSRAT